MIVLGCHSCLDGIGHFVVGRIELCFKANRSEYLVPFQLKQHAAIFILVVFILILGIILERQ